MKPDSTPFAIIRYSTILALAGILAGCSNPQPSPPPRSSQPDRSQSQSSSLQPPDSDFLSTGIIHHFGGTVSALTDAGEESGFGDQLASLGTSLLGHKPHFDGYDANGQLLGSVLTHHGRLVFEEASEHYGKLIIADSRRKVFAYSDGTAISEAIPASRPEGSAPLVSGFRILSTPTLKLLPVLDHTTVKPYLYINSQSTLGLQPYWKAEDTSDGRAVDLVLDGTQVAAKRKDGTLSTPIQDSGNLTWRQIAIESRFVATGDATEKFRGIGFVNADRVAVERFVVTAKDKDGNPITLSPSLIDALARFGMLSAIPEAAYYRVKLNNATRIQFLCNEFDAALKQRGLPK